eukprot:PITA_25814
MEKFFNYEEIEDEKKVKFVVTKLKGHAVLWWDGVQAERKRLGKKPIKNWSIMVAKIREEFYKVSIRTGETQDSDEKVARYVNGLRMDIQDEISILSPKAIEVAYQMALKAEEKLMRKKSARGRGTFRGRGSQGGRGRSTTPKDGASSSSTQRAPTGADAGGRGSFSRGRGETNQRNAIVTQAKGEATATAMIEEENIPERGESLVVNKVLLKPAKEIVEPSQWKTLFRTVCKVQGKCFQVIIDSGNTDNLVSTKVVEKLKLKTMKHPTPYKVSWLQKGHQLLVNE